MISETERWKRSFEPTANEGPAQDPPRSHSAMIRPPTDLTSPVMLSKSMVIHKVTNNVSECDDLSKRKRRRVLWLQQFASGSLQDIGEFRGKPFLRQALQVVSRMT